MTLPADEIHVVSLPMRVPFRGVLHREALLLRGPLGWGEFAPFLEYDDDESARWLAAAHEAASVPWPAPVRDRVPVNATVPAVAAADVAGVLARFPGCTTAKVKVAQTGQSLRDDVERVAAVRDLLGADGRVRVDANAAWSVEDARDAVEALAPFGLEYVEQPCATVEDLAGCASSWSGPASTCWSPPTRACARPRTRCGSRGPARPTCWCSRSRRSAGCGPALEIAAPCGLPVVVSSALDTSVGIAAGVALAAALPELPYACGLATTSLLAADVVTESLDGRRRVDPGRRRHARRRAARRARRAAGPAGLVARRLARCTALLPAG